MTAKKVLFLLPYPLRQAPSQRFRVEAYFELLRKHEIPFDTHEFLNDAAWNVLYKGGSDFQKANAVVKGFVKRFSKVFLEQHKYDLVFVHREASPLGPPVFEWLLAKVFRKKIIYDFDDAIWIPAITESNKLTLHIKAFWKIKHIVKWSYKISAGNEYLANWASRFNRNVVINPTCVDMKTKFNRIKKSSENSPLVIGWTGSHSTLKYLDIILPVLARLEKEFDFRFLVICNQTPSFSLQSMYFKKWMEQTEIEDLLEIDIGVMPLVDDAWSEGKCGFKLIQYLSLGIPAIASAVGVNKQIIEQGRNGLLANTEQEWYEALKTLIVDGRLRKAMGEKGREKVEVNYSVDANEATFISLFTN